MDLKEKLLQTINKDQIVKLGQELIRIPSAVKGIDHGNEQEVAEFIATKLENLGFETRLQEVAPRRPNVIAVLKGSGTGPSLMLNGHMDTIEASGMTVDPYGGEIRDGRLYGRGASDMKGALAAMMVASEAIIKNGVELKGDLMITATVDEEGRGRGSECLAHSGIQADMAIVGELTDMKIGIAHKGLTLIDIKTTGKAAHGSTPQYGKNAIVDMNRIITVLNRILIKKFKGRHHPILGNPTFNIGFIHGGYRANVVPDSCIISIDRRLIPGETYKTALLEIEEILEQLRSENPQLKVEAVALDWVQSMPMEISPNEFVVKSISNSMLTLTGKKPEITSLPYWCDASSFVNIAHIPTAVFGPGELDQAHSASESINIDTLRVYSKAIALTILDICRCEKELDHPHWNNYLYED